MNDTYLIQTKFNDIYRFYHEDNVKKLEKIEFKNYFYILESDKNDVLNMIMDAGLDENLVVEDNIYYDIFKERVIKFIPDKFLFWKIKRLLRSKKIKTYEFDLDVYLKYISQQKPIFLKKRRLGLIDIENDDSLDCETAPKPITAITLLDYDNNIYYTWVLNNEKNQTPENRLKTNEKLFFYKDEAKMLLNFINKFKELNFDVVGGWYCCNFDFPYIFARLKILGIPGKSLSQFDDVNIRNYELDGKIYYDITIFGVELVDFIPVLQKNTCYQAQPASWSLESVAKFYLEKEKLVESGPKSWRYDINAFINYNIRDVELVKEIVDKFKLLDFLLVIQTEIVEVPFGSATHNSKVLLSYLKKNFPEIIIPDNVGEILIEGDSININNHYIKIKAAHVIRANSGIYKNVSIFDFAGLYPTIFRTFNISPDTLNNEAGVRIDDIIAWKLENKNSISKVEKEYDIVKYFNQDFEGIYPKILKIFMDKKNFHKIRKKEFEKKFGKKDINVILETFRSDVFKQIANSLYGVCGFNKFCIFRPEVGAAVTSMSRKLIKFIESFVNSKSGFKALYGDTDSLFIEHPETTNSEEFEKELNAAVKDFVYKNFDINKDRYCLNFEYSGNTFKKFVMKNAKKKYYGILQDNSFYVKGFDIVTHSISKKIKIMLQEIYLKLINGAKVEEMRIFLNEKKKEFYNLDYEDLGIEWKISNDLDEYHTNVRHIRAAEYSNKYLNATFGAGTVGKLLFIKETGKYPKTDILFLDLNSKLPKDFKIDYDLSWEKLILDKIRLLEDVKEMNIDKILNPNKSLFEYI